MLQARMGSSRLPGKVLRDFNGIPLIEHIYNQLKYVTGEKINYVLSTSQDILDDPLVSWANANKISVIRSPVDDIVSRLYNSQQIHNDQYLIRVWGDCVFICPDIIDEMLVLSESKNLDYISNAGDQRNLPIGLDVEIYSASFLKKLNATQDIFLREYPLQYVLKNPETKSYFYRHQFEMPLLHLTVDYLEDLIVSQVISNKLKLNRTHFLYENLRELYQQEPLLFGQFSVAERQKEFKDKLASWQNKGN